MKRSFPIESKQTTDQHSPISLMRWDLKDVGYTDINLMSDMEIEELYLKTFGHLRKPTYREHSASW
jgi:hypothetical protein